MNYCKVCGYFTCQCAWRPQIKKPPLGLIPRQVWIDERRREIIRAMDSYSSAGKVIPREWIEELANL